MSSCRCRTPENVINNVCERCLLPVCAPKMTNSKQLLEQEAEKYSMQQLDTISVSFVNAFIAGAEFERGLLSAKLEALESLLSAEISRLKKALGLAKDQRNQYFAFHLRGYPLDDLNKVLKLNNGIEDMNKEISKILLEGV